MGLQLDTSRVLAILMRRQSAIVGDGGGLEARSPKQIMLQRVREVCFHHSHCCPNRLANRLFGRRRYAIRRHSPE